MNEARSTRVVVGVGESLAALQALRYAVAEARRRGSALRAVRVFQHGADVYGLYASGFAEDSAAVIQRAFDEALGGLPPDLEIELIVVNGAVGHSLAAQASNDSDLLVVGASKRRRWAVSLFAVDQQCARLASCPVLVVPPPALGRENSIRALRRAITREAERYVGAGPYTQGSPQQRRIWFGADRHP